MDIYSAFAALGGVAATHELLARGWTGSQLSRLVHRGEIVRLRQGWYGPPALPVPMQHSVRVGGVLACTSALRHRGLAVLEPVRLHVAVNHRAARLRSPVDYRQRVSSRDDVVVHWSRRPASESRVMQDVSEAITAMAFCQPVERTVAAADSALRTGALTPEQWSAVLAGMPARLALLLALTDARAESITESIARFRLVALGYHPRLQVSIKGVGRVDMMLGPRLVLEFDGWAYHGDIEQFERDRRRDAQLAARGFRTLRFSYRQVLHRWHEVRAAIEGALA